MTQARHGIEWRSAWLLALLAIACSDPAAQGTDASSNAGAAGHDADAAQAGSADVQGPLDGGGSAPTAGAGGTGQSSGDSDGGEPPDVLVPNARECVPVPQGTPLALDSTYPRGGQLLDNHYVSGLLQATIDRQGRLLVVGGGSLTWDIEAARFLDDGALDPTFGDGGATRYDLLGPNSEAADSVTVDARGRIWIGGWATLMPSLGQADSGLLLRTLDSGALDTSFAPRSEVPGALFFEPRKLPNTGSGTTRSVTKLAVHALGAYLLGRYGGFVEHVLDDGSLDPEFAFAGDYQGGPALAFAAQRLYVGDAKLLAFTPSGALDTSFGDQGALDLLANGDSLALRELRPLRDGRMLVFATDSVDAYVLRLTAEGLVDATFGMSGVSAASDFACLTQDFVQLCDGRIATLGKYIRPFPEPDMYCARLLEQDGARATDLPIEGFYTWPRPEDLHADPQVRFDSNGRIVSVWLSSDQTELHRARHNPPWAQE